MKGLPPSLRDRKRYIAFQLYSERELNEREVIQAITNKIIDLYGEFGYEMFKLIEFDGKRGIISVKAEGKDKVKNALTLIDRISDVRVLPIVLGVSGTIKSCKKKYLEV